MARRPQYVPLTVLLNGRNVGMLRRESTGAIEFTYAPEWLEWDSALPVSLSLPLREERYVGAPVFAVFDNLLPESDQIRLRLAERVRAEGADVYSLLAAIGRDCVGALQFLPEGEQALPLGAVEADPLSDEEVGAMIADLAAAPLGLREDEPFRISLAGAQEKTALLRQDGHWLRPRGTTPTTHILKPQIGRTPEGVDLSASVENEYFCMQVTKALGMPTAEVEIANFAGRRVLVVERFDRFWAADGRLLHIPQEDMCQALGYPSTRKYEADGGPGAVAILRLLSGSDRPLEDQRAFLKGLAAFWLLGATDGHAKNFSLRLGAGGSYVMTPLYDIISAQPSVDAGQVRHGRYRLSMAVGDRRHYVMGDIAPRHFLQTAARAGVGEREVRSVLAELADALEPAMQAVMAGLSADFPAELAASIAAGARARLGVLQQGLAQPT